MSTWNKKCGIATYSKNLIKYCPFENIILAPVDDSDITKDEECVARCWHQRRREDFENVITIIKEKEIRVLIIQWHPGIYYGMSFNRLLNELQANNIATILCMHSTSDEKAMGEIKKDLTKFDRVLVHTINDIERLKHYGVVDNVALLPHGVKEFDISKDRTSFREINKDSLTIGTFGFCLPHKGLRELVQAMVIYRRNHSNTKLHGVFLNSIFPSIESDLYAKEIKQLIKRNELDINFDNNFYEESVIANKLSSVDMLMFPYQKTGESASGAVRYAIALKKPTVVTPLEIFDDVRECVEFASDITPESLAASIEDVYNNIVKDCENSMDLNKKQSKWLEEHSYKNISMNLFQMSYALYQDRILKMNGLIDFDDL